VWTAHKYASAQPTDGGCSHIPDLKYKDREGRARYATTNEEKVKVFHDSFFRTTDQASNVIPTVPEYPAPTFKFKQITNQQIHRAIR
jgi:hypothetical protein